MAVSGDIPLLKLSFGKVTHTLFRRSFESELQIMKPFSLRVLPPNAFRLYEGGLRVRSHFQKNSRNIANDSLLRKDLPLVSIITIVFNGRNYLEKTLLSVLTQAYPRIEYIVIDGGSSDGTQEILKRYDDHIDYWVSEPDKGISDAFNKGIQLSSGEVIGILNSDDWYEPNAIKTIVKVYQDHPDSIIHGNIRFWNIQGEPEYIFHGRDDIAHLRPSINHPTVFVPRTVYEKNGLFLQEFSKAMDFEWLVRSKRLGTSFIYINIVLANMRRGGLSDRRWFESYCEAVKARKLHGTSPLLNLYIFLKSTSLTVGRNILEFLGLKKIILFYRSRISIGRKR